MAAPSDATTASNSTTPAYSRSTTALRATEQPVRALEAAITDARAKGNTQLLEYPDSATQRAAYAHAQQMQAAQQGQAAQQTLAAQTSGAAGASGQQAQVVPQGQTSQQNDGDSQKGVVDSSNNNNSSNMMPPQPQPPPQQLPQQQPQQPVPSTSELSMPGHMRSLSGGGLGTQQLLGMPMGVNINPGGVGPSPMITQQMQKLIEQKDRARQNQITHKQTSVPVWQGLVTWSGLNPAGEQREVSSFVIASSTTWTLGCHAKTWPTTLTLTLSRENAVPMRDLQAWMKVVQPALCTFQANPRANNPTHNEMAYKSLVAMLLTKNLYFIGAWALPNGQHSKTVLFFPVHNAGLVGAFFPLTGFADMPPSLQPQLPNAGGSAPNQSSPVPIPNPNPVANPPPQNQQGLVQPQMTGVSGLPPAFVVQLTKMNPVDRNRTMMTIIRNGQEQARQKAAAQNAALGNTNLPQGQQPGMTMGMGQLAMMQQAMGQQQQQGMGQQQQQQGMGQQQQGMGQQQQGIGQQQQGIGQQQQGIGQQQQQPGMGQQQQQGMSQQQQQQQTDMGAFNPAQFGLGGGAAMGGGGMPGGMGGMGGAMGGALGMGGNPGMYSDMMATASLPRSVSGGSGGGGGVSYEMMQSFMQRNQEISGGSGSGG
ncbi:hypothetical protein B0H10DRAFT_2244952 [Mycena sp. CBHHK59/15]|nr:hypothetical protein B0H10DRAFT_2244952 [Mycena sp. CBHHK59/15]